MAVSVTPFLMFDKNAEQAMKLYVSLFSNSKIDSVDYYGADEPGAEGTVKTAVFTIGGQRFMGIDSPAKHEFDFTPSFSIFVECENEKELLKSFNELSADGKVLMPPDNYGFSSKFTWVSDRFGVSWQLNLASTSNE